MAPTDAALELHPIMPPLDEIDLDKVIVHYDDYGDTVHVHFGGRPQPAVIVDLNGFLSLRVDILSQLVVGLQIEGFRTYAIHHGSMPPGLDDLVRNHIDTLPRQRDVPLDEQQRTALLALLTIAKRCME